MSTKTNISLVETVKAIGGVRKLYKGASLCLLRDIPFSAIYFPCYSKLKEILPKDKRSNFVSGTIAALPAAYLVTPFDVIKTRIQTKGNNYKNILDCVRSTWKENGIFTFYKGGHLRCAKSCPQFGITLFFYELFN
jgi:solute carrier family 25 aspartate/glutamate transporter 12/13